MISIRKAAARGLTQTDWLISFHSFSFGDYFDPSNKGFENLRVINEDEIAARTGFGSHPHSNMEILTYVLEGALEHKDSMGNHGVIKAGDVQRMSAGTGVEHSEYNPSPNTKVKLVQIWIFPNVKNTVPSYEHKHFSDTEKLQLIASADGRNNSVTIKQDMDLSILRLQKNETFSYSISKEKAWLQILQGSVKINGHELKAGDGAAIEEILELKFSDPEDFEGLVFDLYKK